MVSALNFGSRGPDVSPGQGHCGVFLGQTLNSQCLSLPTSINGYWQIYCWGNPGMD